MEDVKLSDATPLVEKPAAVDGAVVRLVVLVIRMVVSNITILDFHHTGL